MKCGEIQPGPDGGCLAGRGRQGSKGRRDRSGGNRRQSSLVTDIQQKYVQFDLIELDGEDLRWSPFEQRERALAELLRQRTDGIARAAGQRRQSYANNDLMKLKYGFARSESSPASNARTLTQPWPWIYFQGRQAELSIRGELLYWWPG
jgi:hypothetical protein